MPGGSSSSTLKINDEASEEDTSSVEENKKITMTSSTSDYILSEWNDSSPHGKYGVITFGYDTKNKRDVAVKRIQMSEEHCLEYYTIEVDLLKNAQHPQVVHFFDSITDYPFLYIVTEKLEKTLIKALNDKSIKSDLHTTRSITSQLLQVLEFLKRQGIIHCDIKLENIMLESTQPLRVKLIDFGIAVYSHEICDHQIQGLVYRAPEVVFGAIWSFPVDIWAVACVSILLYTRFFFFDVRSEEQLIWAIYGTLGSPPESLSDSILFSTYFDRSTDSEKFVPCSPLAEEWIKTRSKEYLAKFEEIEEVNQNKVDMAKDKKEFVKFLKQCIKWDPVVRISPTKALQLPFFSLDYIQDNYPAEYFKTAKNMMCQ